MTQKQQYNGEEPIRINKWLAQSGVCSRRKAEELIADGVVFVEGQKITDMGHKILKGQSLEIIEKGREKLAAQFSIIYNKPIGIVSGQAQGDEIPATKMLIAQNKIGEGMNIPSEINIPPVGRLDKDSHGLLILSQDGVLARKIIAPDSGIEKEYEVFVDGMIDNHKIKKLCHGLSLDGRVLKPAKVTLIGNQKLNFILKEGRNRQIRRMCEKLGLNVIDLKRIRIGKIRLEGLPLGKWRHLSEQEIASF